MPRAMSIATIAAAETPSRPGLTSLLRTSRGLMTVQTELVGAPAQFVTIVDFRGRVLKTWKSPLTTDAHDPRLPALARAWHQSIEARVRDSLTRAAHERRAIPDGEAIAHLFSAAMQAYADRDLGTARAVLAACERLLPEEPRIAAALRRLDKYRLPASDPASARSRPNEHIHEEQAP